MKLTTIISRRPVAIAGVALVGASVLAACGSGDSGSGGSSSESATGSGLVKVTVLRSAGATFEPLYIAQDQGYFEDAGLDVEIKVGAADTSQNVPSVLNGEGQFAMTDSAGFLKAAAQGLPVQFVVQIQAAVADAKVSDGTLVPPGSSITRPSELSGKKIGLPALGGNIQMITQYVVEKDGGDPMSLQLVALPPPSLADAATKGDVDGISTFAGFYDGAVAAGFKPMGNGSNDFPGLPQSTIFSSTEWLAQNGDTAKKFADALAKGEEYANAHPDDIRAVDGEYTEMDAETIKNRTIQTFNPTFSKSAVELAAQKMFEYKIVQNEIDTSKVFWDGAAVTN